MAKTTPWIKIKAEYLQGVTPKELALKYKIKAKTIIEKASKEDWVDEKTTISNNLQLQTENYIKKLTQKALATLEDVITNPEAADKDKVAASKAILDVSGLKSSKQEITGKDGAPLTTQKIYVTPQMQIAADKIIEDLKNNA